MFDRREAMAALAAFVTSLPTSLWRRPKPEPVLDPDLGKLAPEQEVADAISRVVSIRVDGMLITGFDMTVEEIGVRDQLQVSFAWVLGPAAAIKRWLEKLDPVTYAGRALVGRRGIDCAPFFYSGAFTVAFTEVASPAPHCRMLQRVQLIVDRELPLSITVPLEECDT